MDSVTKQQLEILNQHTCPAIAPISEVDPFIQIKDYMQGQLDGIKRQIKDLSNSSKDQQLKDFMIEERLKMEKEIQEAEEQDRIAKIPKPRAKITFISFPPSQISGRTLTPITVYTRMNTCVVIKPTKTTRPQIGSLIQWDIPSPPHASKFNIWTVGRTPTVDQVRRLPLRLKSFYKDKGQSQTDLWSNHCISNLEKLILELYDGKPYFVFSVKISDGKIYEFSEADFPVMNQIDLVPIMLFTINSTEKTYLNCFDRLRF